MSDIEASVAALPEKTLLLLDDEPRVAAAFTGKRRDRTIVLLATDDDHRDVILGAALESEPDQRHVLPRL